MDSPSIQRCVISLRRLAITSLVVDLNKEKSPSKETLAVRAAHLSEPTNPLRVTKGN